MKKYPSTEQFRNVVKAVRSSHDYKGKDEEGSPIYQHTEPYPTLTFKGTVKLHGTNAGVVLYKDPSGYTDMEFQSRERILSLTSDNAGFMLAMSAKNLQFLFEGIEYKESIAVYGEWCGGNIQKGVAICSLPKMFVVFAYLVDDEWQDVVRHDNEQGIYHITQFPTYEVDIDFNNPELAQNKLIELTLAVEECCPVGKYFGVDGIGEGLVFSCIERPGLRFKSKGEKHSSSKVKVLNSVDIEQVANIAEFVDYAVTENRLAQGLEHLRLNGIPLTQQSTGDFIRWVVGDIVKEESDTIVKNQINLKVANGQIANKAKQFYFNNI